MELPNVVFDWMGDWLGEPHQIRPDGLPFIDEVAEPHATLALGNLLETRVLVTGFPGSLRAAFSPALGKRRFVRPRPCRFSLHDGSAHATARVLPSKNKANFSGVGSSAEVELKITHLNLTFGPGQAAYAAVPVVGIDGFLGQWDIGEYTIFCSKIDNVSERLPCTLMVFASGTRSTISKRRFHRFMESFMVALELGWGAPLAAPLFAFFNRTQHPIALEITSRSRPTSAGRRGWLSEDSVTGFSQAILFAGMVLPKWDNLCSTYGLRHSAQYLVRANTTAVIEYRARDLAIALERLVKSSRTNKGETLNEGLLRLLRVATMPADSLQREVKTFVQLRNALAHEGTFDIERSGRRLESNARAMHNLTDWLQTFVLRVILSLADWPGLVRDFGALQRVARPPRSLQFVRPKGKLS